LRPQLAVKLQDSDMGGNAWQNQTEIVQKDIPLDRWVTWNSISAMLVPEPITIKLLFNLGVKVMPDPEFSSLTIFHLISNLYFLIRGSMNVLPLINYL
jgi:hypothetical protein